MWGDSLLEEDGVVDYSNDDCCQADFEKYFTNFYSLVHTGPEVEEYPEPPPCKSRRRGSLRTRSPRMRLLRSLERTSLELECA